MGILNVTPDSFSDGGLFLKPEDAVLRAAAMERDGADIIDIGAESTRPGSARISAEEEVGRLLPVIEAVRHRVSAPISVDTYKPEVAERAVEAGARIINFPALGDLEEMARVAARLGAGLVAMHARGTPETMTKLPPLADPAGAVLADLREMRDRVLAAGVPRNALVLDPGFGFGKNGDENYRLLAGLRRLAELDCPLLAGTSRKAFIGRTLDAPARGVPETDGVHPRAWGTAATVTAAILAGVHIVRVHDVKAMVEVAKVADEVASANKA